MAALLHVSLKAQDNNGIPPQEQTSFSAEQYPSLQRPVDVPDGALHILKEDRTVVRCEKSESLSPHGVDASWFVGSKVHLNDPDEVDLVVQPRSLPESPAPNRCLFGAHVVPFWVFQQTPQGYRLVLNAPADGLKILNSRWKGHRDIQIEAFFTGFIHKVIYRFDGKMYQIYKKKSEPIGQ